MVMIAFVFIRARHNKYRRANCLLSFQQYKQCIKGYNCDYTTNIASSLDIQSSGS
jgi:hypothetical protein